MIIKPSLGLNGIEKKAFRLHTFHMFLEGIIDGALLLNEFILIKSLFASNYQVSYLFQFAVVILLFSVLFNELIKRTRNKKRLLRVVAWTTRLPLAVLFFFPTDAQIIAQNTFYPIVFLSVFLVYYLYRPVILPTINLFLRHNYEPNNFGKLYSYSTSVKKIVVLITTFSFGLLLDADHYAFTYVYPVLAFLGVISMYLLSLIDYQPDEQSLEPRLNFWTSVKQSTLGMIRIIKTNKPYRDFEVGFMFYGFAWMATAAVITIFLEDALHLNYTSVAFYKNSYNLLAILLLPLFGKVISRVDPRKFGIVTFGSLLLHLFFMALTQKFEQHFNFLGITFYYSLIISFIFYGVFSAAMALLWGIGSSYFCKKEDAGKYQGIHLSLVGARALFAPIVGVYFFELLGFTSAFSIGMFSLLLAIVMMIWSLKKYNLHQHF